MSKKRLVGLLAVLTACTVTAIVLAGRAASATNQSIAPLPYITVLTHMPGFRVGMQVATANNTTLEVGCVHRQTYELKLGPHRYKRIYALTSSLQHFFGTTRISNPKWFYEAIWITSYRPGQVKRMFFGLRFVSAGTFRVTVRLECTDRRTGFRTPAGQASAEFVVR